MNKKPEQIRLTSDFIELGQFLKYVDLIHTGGEVKVYLKENKVFVNGELDSRRGRKLRVNDIVAIGEKTFQIIEAK